MKNKVFGAICGVCLVWIGYNLFRIGASCGKLEAYDVFIADLQKLIDENEELLNKKVES